MDAETKTAWPREGAAMPEHRGGKNPRAKTAVFVALLLLGLLAGGAWAGAQTPEDGMNAQEIYRAEQPAQSGDVPAARPHLRGLPRRIARQPRMARGGVR